jgi:RHS repeat-associated protein
MELSGNVLNDGQNQYLYDGEGRICAVASTPVPGMTAMTGYLYDASGARVAKGRITAWSCDPGVNGFQTTNDYILGPGGEQVTEMGVGTASSANPASDSNSALTWQHTNVYAAGSLIATYDNDGLHFYFNDPLPGSPATGLRRWGGLGTRRAQTDYAGVLEQTCSSLPFGDALACSGGNLQAPTEHHFTGKERDTESGNDYFGARYYASVMGRFMSPDPSQLYYSDPMNPQSFNLYAYVLNNPLKFIDPSGLNLCDMGTNKDGNVIYVDKSNCSTPVNVQQSVTVNADPNSCNMDNPECQIYFQMLLQQLQFKKTTEVQYLK